MTLDHDTRTIKLFSWVISTSHMWIWTNDSPSLKFLKYLPLDLHQEARELRAFTSVSNSHQHFIALPSKGYTLDLLFTYPSTSTTPGFSRINIINPSSSLFAITSRAKRRKNTCYIIWIIKMVMTRDFQNC